MQFFCLRQNMASMCRDNIVHWNMGTSYNCSKYTARFHAHYYLSTLSGVPFVFRLVKVPHYLSDGGPLRCILSDASSKTRCCRNWCRSPCDRYSMIIASGSLCRMTPNICAMLGSLTRLSCFTASSNALLYRQEQSSKTVTTSRQKESLKWRITSLIEQNQYNAVPTTTPDIQQKQWRTQRVILSWTGFSNSNARRNYKKWPRCKAQRAENGSNVPSPAAWGLGSAVNSPGSVVEPPPPNGFPIF